MGIKVVTVDLSKAAAESGEQAKALKELADMLESKDQEGRLALEKQRSKSR